MKTRFVPILLLWLSLSVSGKANGQESSGSVFVGDVSQNGNAQFSTIQSAIDAVPSAAEDPSTTRYVIFVHPGRYQEIIQVEKKAPILLLGVNPQSTVITNSNSIKDGFSSRIRSRHFIACNITFENTHGWGIQAFSVTIKGSYNAFYNCRFLGWQDTLYLAGMGPYFFQNCYIEGSADFIFGSATAFFQKCQIHCVGRGYITAPSTPKNHFYGLIFSHCTLSAEPAVVTTLGRPWRPYGNTVFLNTQMNLSLESGAWNDWENPANQETARFYEYGSKGIGAAQSRFSWIHQLTATEAQRYTPRKVLNGNDWWRKKNISGLLRANAALSPMIRGSFDN